MQPGAPTDSDFRGRFGPGLRHVTIFFSDIAGFAELTRKLGDLEASRLVNRVMNLQEIIITRDGMGQVLQFGGDSVFAVFQNASVALNRALEIQRILDGRQAATSLGNSGNSNTQPALRIGLHTGEVLVQDGERMEIIGRHVNRARRVMEAAGPGQILASEVVVDAARDFIDVPREQQAIRHYGEFYLKGVGATGLCEVADLRFRQPEPPRLADTDTKHTALMSRLELAGYRNVQRLGEGSFGVVYKAEREQGAGSVAVKVLNPALCEDAAIRKRFADEVARTQKLNLAGTAEIIEHRLDHQPPFFVMDLVEGQPADTFLDGASPERIARVFRDLCSTMDLAHAAGIIHCDLKPGNVLVKADGAPVVMDFGISALAGTRSSARPSSTSMLGTPAFVAPEIIEGAVCGPATDVYSLGAVLFKVLTGREPFVGETVHQILQAHLHEDPTPPASLNPTVADGLQRICLKALEKKPEDRYQTAREMADDLDRFVRGEVVHTRPNAYDNLLFHRVRKHVAEVRDWRARGLLSDEESDALLSSYEGLQRRGLPAVMEGRFFRFWQTLVYIGGWAVINGALLWLTQHWASLTRTGKLLLGSVPALTTFVLAIAMWRLQRFRLSFVALIVAVLATPLATGVWLHEFKLAANVPESGLGLELFHRTAESDGITNQQILLTMLAALVVAGGVMTVTRTTTHSAQTLAACVLFYSACLLFHGLRPDAEQSQWARLGLKYLPLLLIVSVVGGALLQNTDRHYQAPPWLYFAAVLLLVIGYAISLHGVEEWTKISTEKRQSVSYCLLSLIGMAEIVIGVMARGLLRHRCRPATLAIIFFGLVNVLAGFGRAGWTGVWPANWPSVEIFGKMVPAPHVVLPLAALAITLLACKYQMLAFLLVGMAGLAFSIHVLGHLYFEDAPTWPKVLMALGAVCFFAALYRELRRTKGNTIDDVLSQTRL